MYYYEASSMKKLYLLSAFTFFPFTSFLSHASQNEFDEISISGSPFAKLVHDGVITAIRNTNVVKDESIGVKDINEANEAQETAPIIGYKLSLDNLEDIKSYIIKSTISDKKISYQLTSVQGTNEVSYKLNTGQNIILDQIVETWHQGHEPLPGYNIFAVYSAWKCKCLQEISC
jgi:hypothetical protein